MNINVIQHVDHEGPGRISRWANIRGIQLTIIDPKKPSAFEDVSSFDPVIIMGGPMSAYEEELHPWLKFEKDFILKAIKNRVPVLGICLGAQLIASALGSKVYKNPLQEIGWYPVVLTDEGRKFPVFNELFSGGDSVFHWHGDTFQMPHGAIHLLMSNDCQNQAFAYGDKVLGIQFHIEMGPEEVELMILHGQSTLDVGGPRVQTPEEMRKHQLEESKLTHLLDWFFRVETSCDYDKCSIVSRYGSLRA